MVSSLPQRQQKKVKKKLSLARILLLGLAIIFLIILGAGTGCAIGLFRTMPEWDPAKLTLAMNTFIYDKDGQLVEQLRGEENRIVVPLEKIPKHLQNAVIAIEDNRFYQHHGVDLKAILRATWINLRSGKIQEGGSTLTQQLAKNAFIDNPERTLKRKIQEAILALKLERTYTKKEILENYLNIVYLGRGTYGVETAARAYFGKSVSDLDLAESAFLAGLIQSPASYDPRTNWEGAKNRQSLVLDCMVKYGFITPQEAEEAKNKKLEFKEAPITRGENFPYFIDAVIDEAGKLLESQGIPSSELYRGGLKIYTSLDQRIQREMEAAFRDKNSFPPGAPDRPIEGAMVVLDPHTGEIRGLVGGRDYKARRGFNRATQAQRQPGSTIKPLVVYGPALEKGYPPAYVIDDVPTTFPGNYRPENYDGRYRGLITMREALRWSVNVAAVKMLHTIGIETGYEFGKRLGLPLRPEDKNLSLALGGLTTGVSPVQMAGAYAAFANGGTYITPHCVTKIADRHDKTILVNRPPRRVVMSEQVAYLMTDMLKTVVTSGTGRNAQIPGRPVAGKTGTTSLPETPEFRGLHGEKDAWFAGYTPELVGVVWMGYDHTDPQHYLKGVAGGGYPALLWRRVLESALRDKPVQDFPRPAGIVYIDVDAKSGLLPSSLTPKEFIIKEVFAESMIPKKISDVWVEVKVCATSSLLASPHCPNVVTKVFLRRPSGTRGGVAEDSYLEPPTQVCTLHGPEEKQPPEPPDKDKAAERPENGSKVSPPSLRARLEVGPNLEQPKVVLEWTAPPGDFLFTVERRSPSGKAQKFTPVRGKSFTDTDVEPGQTYIYRVVPANAPPSNEVTVAIPER